MTIPNVDILTTDRIFLKGAGALKDIPGLTERFGMVPLEDLLNTDWEDDTHFVCYRTFGDEDNCLLPEEQYRLRKTIRCQIEDAGGSIRAWAFVADWDLKDNVTEETLREAGWDGDTKKKPKISWTSERIELFEEGMELVVEALGAKNIAPAYAYLTTHGARIIHLYETDVDVIEHEQISRGMLKEYEDLGFPIDPMCLDWTRLFRAPRVVRNGKLTSKEAWFRKYEWDNWTLSTLAPKIVKPVDNYANVSEYDGDQPEPEEAVAFLQDIASGKKTDTYKKLKALLSRRDLQQLHDILTGKNVNLSEGERDGSLTVLVGQACAHTYAEAWSSAELVYALLLPVAEQLEPDAGTHCWLSKLWGLCKRMWTKEQAKGIERQREEELQEEQKLEGLDGLLKNLRKLYPHNSRLFYDDDRALEEMGRMGLLKTGSAIYVLKPSGYYTEHPASGAVLPGVIRDNGMDFLMPTKIYGPKGGCIRLSATDLLQEYGRPIRRVVGTFGMDGALFAEGDVLKVPLFKFADHAPIYDARVEEWLHKLSGDKYEDLCRWIAYAQDMRRPICAMALVGPRGVGKGLLASGLQELIQGAPVPASGQDIVSQYTPALTQTPFVVVDEGLYFDKNASKDVADSFRRLVAGEPCRVNIKFQPEVEVQIPFRLLFTANNREIVNGLVGNRTLTYEDREALAERIKFLEVENVAAVWLRKNGGRNFTAGWVSGDGPSDFILARHFRWMYENRMDLYGPPDSDRFLVTGDMSSVIVDDIRVASGVTPEVAKVCIHIIAANQLPSDVADGVCEDPWGFWMSSNAVITFYNSVNVFDKKAHLNETNVGRAMRNISICSERGQRKSRKGQFRNINWHQIDIRFLLKYAREHGLPTDALELRAEREVIEDESSKAELERVRLQDVENSSLPHAGGDSNRLPEEVVVRESSPIERANEICD